MIDLSQKNQVRFNIEIISGGTELVLHGKYITKRKTKSVPVLQITTEDLQALKMAVDAEFMRRINSGV